MIRRGGVLLTVLTLALPISIHGQASTAAWLDTYRGPAARLIDESVSSAFAWQRLAVLTDTIGNRLSGTPELDRAIAWAVDEMKRDGLENVHTEPVRVPSWIRGEESAAIVEPVYRPLTMLGLGGSIATSGAGVEAPLTIVHNFAELDAAGGRLRGRIVLFNVPFTAYQDTVRFRTTGASRAARHGAVAMLVRSIGPDGLRLAHTGALEYDANAPKIPAAAVSSEDADRLERMIARGNRVVVRLKMQSHFAPDAQSANVVGEIVGRDRPDEVVVVSGHLDSWDVGDGASDDGGGCVVTWEALRLMKKLGLRPRRTVRVVLWTNEENGGAGGRAYQEAHRAELPKHVMMMESDSGVSRPLGFGFSGSDSGRDTITAIASLLSGIGANRVLAAAGGADIAPSAHEARVPTLSLDVDTANYFRFHHTNADTIDKIDPFEMAKCAAAVAVVAYVVADMEGTLR